MRPTERRGFEPLSWEVRRSTPFGSFFLKSGKNVGAATDSIEAIDDACEVRSSVGNFDGVHRGH